MLMHFSSGALPCFKLERKLVLCISVIVFNHTIACYFFFSTKKGKKKPDSPPPVPIDSGPCGTTMTSASIGSGAGHPRCIPQTSATRAECVISCCFLCRPARSVFASWFYIFADSRRVVTFCSVRFSFRFWECMLMGTFSLLFRPRLTSPIHPAWMAEVRQISSSSS